MSVAKPYDRAAVHGISQVPYQDRVDVLPGEVLQVLTEKECSLCGVHYRSDRCPYSNTIMHQAFASYDKKQRSKP